MASRVICLCCGSGGGRRGPRLLGFFWRREQISPFAVTTIKLQSMWLMVMSKDNSWPSMESGLPKCNFYKVHGKVILNNFNNCCFMFLKASEEFLDINFRNQHGLTPLMLAVRDADLFERLDDMPAVSRPAEALSALLRQRADPELCDFSGKPAIHYVSQIESFKKQQLLNILMNSMSKPERHAESLFDICHGANSPPADLIVTKTPNISLQSISRSEEFDQEDDCSQSTLSTEGGEPSGHGQGGQSRAEEFSTSDMKSSSQSIEFPLLPLALFPMRHGHLLTIPPHHKDRKEREGIIPSLVSFIPKLSEPVEFRPSNKQPEAPFKVFLDQTLRSSESFIWSRNMCSFWKANHHKPHLEMEENKKSNETEGCNKIQISHFEKRRDVSFEKFREGHFSADREVDVGCLGSETRKAEDKNTRYLSLEEKKEDSVARNNEQNSDVGYTMLIKFQEAQHSEINLSKDKETTDDEDDSKSVSVHKGEIIGPNHILEEFAVLKSVSNVIPDSPIEKLPEGRNNMETNIKISVAEPTKPEMNGVVPFVHISFPGDEPPKDPAIAKPSLHKRKGTLYNNSSFNLFAYQESDRRKMKTHKNKLDSKTKPSNRTPQNSIISTEDSIKPTVHKTSIKPQVFPSLGLVDPRSRQSPKFQRRMPQIEKKQSTYQALKPKKQSFPCICKNSRIKKCSVPLAVQPTESRLNYLDLKYSDMFKEINSTANGPGIYEMFGTPVYCHMREAERYENRYHREIRSAPLGRWITGKCQSSHSERSSNSRTRLSQKRLHAKSPKALLGIKHKHKNLISKEKGCKTVGSNPQDIENDGGISEPAWQMKSLGNHFLSSKDEVQPMNFAQTHEQSTEQNEFFPASDLSIVEEVSVGESADEGDIFHNQILAMSLRNLHELEELHHQTPFFLSENSWAVPSEKSFSKHVPQEKQNIASLGKINANHILMNDGEFDSLIDKYKTLMNCSFQEEQESASSHTYQHWTHSLNHDNLASKSIVHQTFGKILSDTNSISLEILDSMKNKELTDELLGSLAEELLALDEKDNSCQIMANETDPENLNLVFSRRGSTTQELGGETTNVRIQRHSNGFGIYNEKTFLNEKKIFSENSLKYEEPILWTKGEILGKGAYGTVYCGLTSQGQLIAVKQVVLDTSDKLATEKEYRKLQEEVDLLKALKHVNIVAYLGTFLEENTVNIFMEFVPGGSISSIINRFGPLPEMVFCKYTKQILQGVAYLHENCVVHRDIKGNNVMLMPTGIIKLIDFGCAKRLACTGLSGTHSDMLKSMHGTPYWMAPEVINESGYGRKSDIWSIGCTVFEMATGKPPLASMNRMAAMFYIGAHRGLMPPLPEYFSENAADFVRVCLTRDQHERPSAAQLLEHSFLKRTPSFQLPYQ
ncbi:mitogen-activated protein kinase kinase kinase 19 isoform X3 [Saccopteryx leptura]|uniref:mitogen-activated protein kinase kinase kinase 19 isoform X3 n=1 Tax=Saccopteryx leptura TaxID=249018 RepID=UPI00339CFE5A